jgi:two-component system chemotaxis response regulator CheY
MANIMVVDDAAFMRMKCVKLLTENGYEVLEAGTGAQAVEKYKLSRPNGVLLDITMPDMDGISALKQIREIDPDARIAMVTAMGQQAIVIEALKGGATDFVVKPFDSTRLLTAVKKLVG